jgi:HEPN domain-containing protein
VSIPADPDARRYYRAGLQRLEDARFILAKGRRTTAAVYLAGYCVEFLLKALILSQTPGAGRGALSARLRTHSIEGLRKLYTGECGGEHPGGRRQGSVLAQVVGLTVAVRAGG